jgi:hypothetical protein
VRYGEKNGRKDEKDESKGRGRKKNRKTKPEKK